MAEPTLPDPEEMLASLMEGHERMCTAGRKVTLDALQSYQQVLGAVADSGDQLAVASDIDWVSRLFHAQAGFTRDMADATSKFVREVIEA